jgi:hypothetical protein
MFVYYTGLNAVCYILQAQRSGPYNIRNSYIIRLQRILYIIPMTGNLVYYTLCVYYTGKLCLRILYQWVYYTPGKSSIIYGHSETLSGCVTASYIIPMGIIYGENTVSYTDADWPTEARANGIIYRLYTGNGRSLVYYTGINTH